MALIPRMVMRRNGKKSTFHMIFYYPQVCYHMRCRFLTVSSLKPVLISQCSPLRTMLLAKLQHSGMKEYTWSGPRMVEEWSV